MGNPKMIKGGPSLNPSGRPKGFSRLIRERTGERGERLFELARQIMEGDVSITPAQQRVVERLMKNDPTRVPELVILIEKMNFPSIKERLDALKYLADHGHGKATEHVELTGQDGGPLQLAAIDVSKYSPEEKETLIRLLEKGGGAMTEPEQKPAFPRMLEAVATVTEGELCSCDTTNGKIVKLDHTCPTHGPNPEAVP